MSAFICSDRHVSILAAWGVIGNEWNRLHSGTRTYEDPAEVFRVLKDENIRSVRYRYPDEPDSSLPGVQGEARKYDRGAYPGAISPVQILKACACLEYQSCETPDYRETEAFRLLEAIRYKAINALPGYADAAWEMSA